MVRSWSHWTTGFHADLRVDLGLHEGAATVFLTGDEGPDFGVELRYRGDIGPLQGSVFDVA